MGTLVRPVADTEEGAIAKTFHVHASALEGV